jgi:hypothetical protein
MPSPNPQQGALDALTFQANQIPDDESDVSDDNGDDPTDRPPNARPFHHHVGKTPFDFPRPAERNPVPAPKRSPLVLPPDPKHINGKQLTDATRKRDRDMLESRKSR